jgi:hypothetical protein
VTLLHSPRNDLARSDGLPSLVKSGCGLGLALVHDMRGLRAPSDEDEVAAFETDVLAGVGSGAGLGRAGRIMIRDDTGYLDLIRDWFGRPLWERRTRRLLRQGAAGSEAAGAHGVGGRAGGLLTAPGTAALGRGSAT